MFSNLYPLYEKMIENPISFQISWFRDKLTEKNVQTSRNSKAFGTDRWTDRHGKGYTHVIATKNCISQRVVRFCFLLMYDHMNSPACGQGTELTRRTMCWRIFYGSPAYPDQSLGRKGRWRTDPVGTPSLVVWRKSGVVNKKDVTCRKQKRKAHV